MNAAGGRGRGRGAGGRGRGGRGFINQRRRGWVSKHDSLKYDVFEEGTAEKAGQYTKSMIAVIEYIRKSGQKEAETIATAIENEEAIIIAPPDEPVGPEDPNNPGAFLPAPAAEQAIFTEEIRMVAKRRHNVREGMPWAYAILKGQCSPSTWGKISGEAGFEAMEAAKDPIQLKQRIKAVCCGFQAHQQRVYAVVQAIILLATTMQENNDSIESFYRNFTANWDMIEQFGGSVANHPGLIEERAVAIAAEDGRDADNVEAADTARATEEIGEEVKASFMLCMANKGRYQPLKDCLANDYVRGQDTYPKTCEQLMGMLRNYRAPRTGNARGQGHRNNQPDADDGLAFVQEEDKTEGESEGGAMMAQQGVKYNKKGEKDCYHCGADDHWAPDCPKKQDSVKEEKHGKLFLQTDGAMISQARCAEGKPIAAGGIRSNRLYLDTCTTNNQFSNPTYLTGIHTAEVPLRLHTNAGTSVSTQQGYLGSTLFWLDRMGIANVISLKSLEEKYHVTYDSTKFGGSFLVHTESGIVTFKRCPETSFPYIDLDDMSQGDQGAMLVQTVRKNYEGFTRREVERAREVRELQSRLGQLSETELKTLLKEKDKVSNALLKNIDLTTDDLENSNQIFGPAVARLKGTSVRTKPIRAEPEYVRVPREIVEMNKFVTLVADVMFVCGLPFLISMSRRIRFVTIQFMPNRTAGELCNGLKDILKLYKRAGFTVQAALMDNEFEPLTKLLLRYLEVNTTAKNEHVGEIERKIRHVKNRSRSVVATQPYKKMPNCMIKALLTHVVMWMNAIFSKLGVSELYSPRELVLRRQLDVAKHAKVKFGSYCEVYAEPNQTNTMESRTRSCICLGPTGNFQGTYKFLDLETGRVIKRRSFTELPVTDSIKQRVEYWADRDKQEARDSLSFRNRNNERFHWDDDVDDEPLIEDNAPEPVAPFPDIPAEMPGNVLTTADMPVAAVNTPELDDETRIRRAAANADIGPDIIPADDAAEDDRSGRPITNNYVYNLQQNNQMNNVIRQHQDGNVYNNDVDEDGDVAPDLIQPDDSDDEDEDDEDYVPSDQEDEPLEADDYQDDRSAPQEENTTTRSGRRVVAPNRYIEEIQMFQSMGKWDEAEMAEKCLAEAIKEQPEMIADVSNEPIELFEGEEKLFGCLLIQLSLKEGLRRWGQRGADSAIKEMKQMHDLQAFFPRDPKTMTREQRVKALSSLIFLKEKSTGEIKSRTCINGAPQRSYIKKEDAASPTAATDSVFMVGAINAYENRDVATMDLPGAFLNTLTDEQVFMVLKGELCELMVQVDPKIYRKYVTRDKKGKPVMYVQLYKSLYGLLRSALLFYRKLRKELEAFGFEINPYDPCVANKMSECGHQQTVIWHVDDLQASHVDARENTKLIKYLRGIYGDKMTINRGKKHRYLGMDLDYSKPGVLSVSMIPYIQSILEDFPELITKSSRTPHTDNLFKVRDPSEAEYLPEEQAQQFHRVVAQLLFLSCRARRDIQTPVAFLTTRVKKPDADDWGKVKRVLQYLRATMSMPLNLTVDNLQCTRWFVDASHGVHDDCKGHTGAGMTLGRGAAISFSRKQKINTRSSTESELVGVDDAMPTILWSLYFLQEQGYGTSHAVIYQDNKSAILLETNGKFSSSKRTKHIKMKYFFVKDKVEDGEVKIEHLGTDKMWIDMNSKPSQGIRFETDRSEMQNVPVHWPDETLPTSSSSALKTPTMTTPRPQECVGSSATGHAKKWREKNDVANAWHRPPSILRRGRYTKRAACE